MSTRSDFRFFERLRVRWAEVDLQQIVFNGHYLMYFDTAVAGWWRALALPYQATMAALDGDLYVRKASLEYVGSARYDDLIDVGVKTARIGTSSMVLHCAVFRGDELLVSGELVYVFANPANAPVRTSQPVPQALRDVLLAFDAGQPMVGEFEFDGVQLTQSDKQWDADRRIGVQLVLDLLVDVHARDRGDDDEQDRE